MFRKLTFLLALLAIFSLSLASCGEEEVCNEHRDDDANGYCDICEAPVEPPAPECEHRDENADYACDICEADFFPECYDHVNENGNSRCDICGEVLPINVTIKVCDQEGTPLSGVRLTLSDSNDEAVNGETNSSGEIELSLLPKSYRVSYDEETIPDGYIAYSSTVEVTEASTEILLEVLNNIPNGTEERPFVIDPELEYNYVTLTGGEKSFYIVPHGGSRIVSFIGEDYEIVYYKKGSESGYEPTPYTPDTDGIVSFRFTETDIKTPSLFTIENKGSVECEIAVELKSEPGTMAKPYEIDDVSGAIVCTGVAGNSTYYKWIATETGELKLYAGEFTYSIRIGSTDAVLLAKTDGTDGLLGIYDAQTPEGALEIEILDGTILVRESAVSTITAGTEYKYEINTEGKFIIKDSETDEEIEPFMISPADRVITVTNNRNSNQQRIEENSDELHILVNEGDEIIIAIYTAFDMDVEFKLEY